MSETDQDIENNKLIKLSDDNKPPSGIKGWFWEPRPGIDKIPLRLFFKNRWFRAVVFFLYCFCCTEIHQGWQQLSRMLYRSGAYSWHCSPSELVGPYDYCTKQYNTISNLLTIGQSCEYVFGVVAGLSLDHVGPWPTGAIGIVMHLIGILLLVQSSESFKAYIPAMIFITGSINMVCFPMLCLADLFPNWRGLVISFVSCSQIVSTMMAPIWKAIWDQNPGYTFKGIIGTYALVVSLPLGVFYLLSMPWAKLNGRGDKSEQCEPEEYSITATTPNEEGRKRRGPYTFWQQFTSPDYVLFTVWYIMQVMMFGYFPTFVLDYAGKHVSDYLGYLAPSQGVFGFLFGLAVDYTTTIPLAFGINGGIVLAYLLALIKKSGVQYVSSTMYVIANSYIYASKYTFIAERFPARHWGKLMGFTGCIAGFMNLINIAVEHSNKYTAICLGYAIVGAVDILLLLWHLRRSIRGVNYL